jgi:hypothetical protein
VINGPAWDYGNKSDKLHWLREEVQIQRHQIERLENELIQLLSLLGYTRAKGGELIKDGMVVAL